MNAYIEALFLIRDEIHALQTENDRLRAAISKFSAATDAGEWAWDEFSAEMQEAYNEMVAILGQEQKP